MSRKTRTDYVGSARDRARQAATQIAPVAEQVKPLAKNTGEAAKRGLRRTRAWAAPQVERTGHVLQDSVAPKVSAMLSAAAQRIDPAKPARGRWRKPVGVATITAAVSAAVAYLRSRMKPQTTTADGGRAPAGASHNGRAPAEKGADLTEHTPAS